MEKEDQLKAEIKELIKLTLKNVKSGSSTVEQNLEGGLTSIGIELETGERNIIAIWAEYEGQESNASVKYPKNFSLQSDSERREEAKQLREFAPTIPSVTFQKAVCKRAAAVLLGTAASSETLKKIDTEIDSAAVIVSDPETIKTDFENGFVSTETASKIRGYPEGEVEQAKKDHAERAARIALAQSEANQGGIAKAEARGVNDLGNDKTSAKNEKTTSQDPAMQDDSAKAVKK